MTNPAMGGILNGGRAAVMGHWELVIPAIIREHVRE